MPRNFYLSKCPNRFCYIYWTLYSITEHKSIMRRTKSCANFELIQFSILCIYIFFTIMLKPYGITRSYNSNILHFHISYFLIKNDVEYISISLFNTAILSFHYHFVFVRSLLTENVTGIRSWISFVHFVFCFMKDTKISFLRHYLVLPVILINFPNYYIQTITMRCVSHHLHLSPTVPESQ